MNSNHMLLVTKNRVEFHPDFAAELFARWRVGWSLMHDQQVMGPLVRDFDDDLGDIPKAIKAAKQQICNDVVRGVCSQFWTEFQIANSLKSQSNGKPSSPADPTSPSL
jgi:hypothetical protein